MGFYRQTGHKIGSILIKSILTFIFKIYLFKNLFNKHLLSIPMWKVPCRLQRLEEKKTPQHWFRHYHCLPKRVGWRRHIWRPGQNRRVGRDGREQEQIPKGTLDVGLSVTLTLLQGQDGEVLSGLVGMFCRRTSSPLRKHAMPAVCSFYVLRSLWTVRHPQLLLILV